MFVCFFKTWKSVHSTKLTYNKKERGNIFAHKRTNCPLKFLPLLALWREANRKDSDQQFPLNSFHFSFCEQISKGSAPQTSTL